MREFLYQVRAQEPELYLTNMASVFMITLIFRNILPASLGNLKHEMDREEFEHIYQENIFLLASKLLCVRKHFVERDLTDSKQ